MPEVLADNPGVIWVQGLCPSTRRLARHHSRGTLDLSVGVPVRKHRLSGGSPCPSAPWGGEPMHAWPCRCWLHLEAHGELDAQGRAAMDRQPLTGRRLDTLAGGEAARAWKPPAAWPASWVPCPPPPACRRPCSSVTWLKLTARTLARSLV